MGQHSWLIIESILRKDLTFGLSASRKKCFYGFNESFFKMMKKAFHLKSSFRSEDIYIFVLTFWSQNKRFH